MTQDANSLSALVRAKPKSGLSRASPDTQAFSSMLMEEIRSWPAVTDRPMFGFQGFYRGDCMFAALPKTRSVGAAGMMFNLPMVTPALRARIEADSRVNADSGERWITFELSGEADIRGALEWLETAYQLATKAGSKRKGTRGR